MSQLNFELQERRKELGKYLRQYLEESGVKISSSGQMSCWLGTHNDANPSMSLMKPDYKRCYCFSCSGSADIFDAANILEGKPLNGKGFVVDNLNYLSKRFGFKPLELELTEQDERELKSERIHRVAAGTFRKRLNIEQAKVRGWFDEARCRHFGIGSIENTDAFIQFIMKSAKVTKQDIEDSGLDIRMFAPHMLTFVLEDDKGECVGFAARNMNYEKTKEQNPDANIQKFLKPRNGSPLYSEGSYIYNLQRAKKEPTVVLTEGFAEVMTAHMNGLNCFAAYGANRTLRDDKIETLLQAGVNSVVLAGGYDFKETIQKDGSVKVNRAAQDGTLHALKMLRKYPEIRVRVIDFAAMADEYMEKHPDAEKFALDECFKVLGAERVKKAIREAVPAVQFTVVELKERGLTDPNQLARELVEIIAHEPDPLEVPDQIKIVAEHTGFDIDALTEAVKRKRRMLDDDRRHIVEDMVSKFNRRSQGARSVMDLIDMASGLSRDLSKVDPRNQEVSVEQEMRWVQAAQERVWGEGDAQTYKTGLTFFDKDMGGGLPAGYSYIMFPGDQQTGKSMSVQRIAYGLVSLNENVDVAVLASDDGCVGWLHRLWCMESELPLHFCKRPMKYMDSPEHDTDRRKLQKAQDTIAELIKTRRLTIRDSGFGTDMTAVRKLIENHYRRSDRPLVMILDGIHKLRGTTKQEVLDAYSTEIKQTGQEFDMPFLVTAELRKRGSETGFSYLAEPTEEDVKGSKQLVYDADAIYIMDNPKNRMRERRDQMDKKGNPLPCYKDFSNTHWERVVNGQVVHEPTLWTHRTKNKIFDENGHSKKYYSEFHPSIMRFKYIEPNLTPDAIDMSDTENQ